MRLKEIKSAVLKKGWAGRTISRSETARRLNPLITAHMALNHWYNDAIARYPDQQVSQELDQLQKQARTDVGKMLEVVFSCGGVPPNGTDMKPDQFALPNSSMLATLQGHEEAFLESLQEEKTIEHQIRTEAVINHLIASSQARLVVLRGSIRLNPRQIPA